MDRIDCLRAFVRALEGGSFSVAANEFGIGQPVRRTEDPKLVRGEGRFTDDVGLPGQAHAVMVRSRNAHGIIRSIDVAAASALPGVLGVYTGADLVAAGYGTFKCIVPFNNRDGSPMHKPARPALPEALAATVAVVPGRPAAMLPAGAPAAATRVPAVDSGRLITRPTLSLPLVLTRLRRASASGVTPY